MEASNLSEAEVNNFNIRRQAIQNTITWEYEMWRRQTQAQFEIEQDEKEQKIKEYYDSELLSKRKQLTSSSDKQDLLQLQQKLNQLLNQLSTSQQQTENLKNQLAQAQELAQDEYTQSLQKQKQISDSKRQILVKKIATQRAKQQEMQQRSQFFRDELSNYQERLNQDLVVYDQQRREFINNNESKIHIQIQKLNKDMQELDRIIAEKDKTKNELKGQLQRAARIKVQMQLVLINSDDE
ncbi:hypothetical protein SS50377_27450 [Spironucleus salmonicida]|uniref:Uncharacterized protein n=1 Tax=Spironucleus salmonicida TaxID=348837 RepID=V6LFE7_9EUKA|nr:hypothetical protein SS50377_27450 [Spironucleus salmonicida]|eukprot:EST43260.1 hypothetical protein SS50377_16924 [Spironucleus salmonicida]